jgi:hypothetical protein
MAQAAKVTAMLTVECWPEPDASGYLVRALVRGDQSKRDLIGPVFVGSLAEVRNTLREIIESLISLM